MHKLLCANFTRLKKNKLFWACLIFMFAFGLLLVLAQYREHIKYNASVSLISIFFGYALVIGIVMAMFSSLFLGTEYSDGTIRNKLTIGHSRAQIYAANLLTNIIVSCCMCLSFLLSIIAVGIPLLGFATVDLKMVLWVLLGTFVLCIAFCAIFTLISMVCSNKAAVAVISIVGFVVLLLLASMVKAKLDAPEFYDAYTLTDSAGNIETKTVRNPKYLAGAERSIYEFLYDFLPTGQAMQYTSMTAVHLWQMPLYALSIAILSTAMGMWVFRKKDIK